MQVCTKVGMRVRVAVHMWKVQRTRLCPAAPVKARFVSDIWSRQHLPGTLGLTRPSPSAAVAGGAAGLQVAARDRAWLS